MSKVVVGSPPTEQEQRAVSELRKRAEKLVATAKTARHPELCHDLKLLRYIRGHPRGISAAAAAFAATLRFREAHGIDEVRREILCAKADNSDGWVWPYLMPRFRPLLDVWKGVPPVVFAGVSAAGDVVTLTCFASYNFPAIVAAKLGDLWLRLVVYCDVFFDLLEHDLSMLRGRPVARHDLADLHGVRASSFSLSALNLLRRMGALSSVYPELVMKTTVLRTPSVVLPVWKILRTMLPARTANKFNIFFDGDDVAPVLASVGLDLPPRFGGNSIRFRNTVDRLPLSITPSPSPLPALPVRTGERVVWRVQPVSPAHANEVVVHVELVAEGGDGRVEVIAPRRRVSSFDRGVAHGEVRCGATGFVRLTVSSAEPTAAEGAGQQRRWSIWGRQRSLMCSAVMFVCGPSS